MATNRKPKALLDAEKRISDLESKLKSSESTCEMYRKMSTESNTIIEGLHDILDDLGIKGYKDENHSSYNRLPLAVRLFAWAMKMASEK